MEGIRIRARVRPPFVLLGVALLVTAALPGTLHAGLLPAGVTPSCGSVTPAAALRAAGPQRVRGQAAKVSPVLGKRGELTGRALNVYLPNRTVAVALPIESSVSEALGDLLLVTRATGTGSEVRAISLATGCETRLTSFLEIARGATVDPDGDFLYVHGVTRVGRADIGVTRYDIATGQGTLVVPPVSAGDHVGPIFGTDLRWSIDGSALAVQSCGFRQCVARVLDVASGDIATYGEPGQGAFIGLTHSHLVTFGACPGLPCAVLSTDLSTGQVARLADEAFVASMTGTGDGNGMLTIETAAGNMEFVQ